MVSYLPLLVFPLAMAFAGAMDLLTMTIPNRISLALVASFALLAPFFGLSWHDILVNHIAIGAAVLACGVALFAARIIGGGDAKLMAAGALWIGWDHLLEFVLAISVAGGILSLVVLAYRHYVPAAAITGPSWAIRLHKPGGGIPYGIAIAAAAMIIFPSTAWYAGFAG